MAQWLKHLQIWLKLLIHRSRELSEHQIRYHTHKKKISQIPAYRVTQGMFSSVQLLNCVWLFVTPRITARQVSLSVTNSRNLLKLMSIKSVMPSNYLILCHPLVLLPSIFPSIRVYSNESAVHIGWPEYWSIGIRHIIEC